MQNELETNDLDTNISKKTKISVVSPIKILAKEIKPDTG